MAKRIVFSKKAYADIDRIVEFNNRRNQSDTYSKKFIKNLHSSLITLSKHPSLGIRTNMTDQLLFIWDTFYIFYINTETAIEITSIYHQKEDVSFWRLLHSLFQFNNVMSRIDRYKHEMLGFIECPLIAWFCFRQRHQKNRHLWIIRRYWSR